MSEMIERVMRAIDDAPSVFARVNKAHPLPHEVCIDRKPSEPIGEDSIEVLSRWGEPAEASIEAQFWQKFYRAKAAIEAMREPTEAMIDDATLRGV